MAESGKDRSPIPHPDTEAGSGLTLNIALGALFLGSVGGAWALYEGSGQSSFWDEVGKALLQVGIVFIAAATIAILTHARDQRIKTSDANFTHERDRRIAQRDADLTELKQVLSRLIRSYNSVKSARRMMRALAQQMDGDTTLICVEAYDTYMAQLNTAQLDLEAIISELESSPSAENTWAAVEKYLVPMEEYLGDLITEFEHERPTFQARATVRLGELKHLRVLLGSHKGSAFQKEFLQPYEHAVEALRSDLRQLVTA